ncbi:MAG: LD-carboxypeptidase [Calditrichales bacterium]|nr:MAG: LD-carboxypeptidase [Calditrichales bacterium]
MLKTIPGRPTIGIISPAFIPVEERLRAGIHYLENLGCRVKRAKYLGQTDGYFAGTDAQRVADIHQMFADPEVDLIICARGGWGGLRMLDQLDYDLLRQHAKLLVGYSDVTSLQLAMWKKSRIPSLSGPMVGVEMGKGILPFTEKHFWGQVHNPQPLYEFGFSQTKTSVLIPGRAEGILLGGCLSLVSHLLGTPYQPDFSNTILFLEDVGEEPYKIDRYLAHLKQAGVFNQINGLILGEFVDCEAEAGKPSFTLNEILQHYFSEAAYPVLMNFPYGHDAFKFSMPVGVNAVLDTDKKLLQLSNPNTSFAFSQND